MVKDHYEWFITNVANANCLSFTLCDSLVMWHLFTLQPKDSLLAGGVAVSCVPTMFS